MPTDRRYPGPETIHRDILSNGITVLTYENPASATVVFDGFLRTGALAEPADRAGLADFTSDLLIRGTRSRTFEEIAEALESVGAGLSFGSGRHTTGFSARGLAEDFDLLLELLTESLRYPAFPGEQVERLRGQILTGLQMRANDTRQMARLAFHELAYEGHPFGRSVSGYPETIGAILREDIVGFHDQHFGPEGMVIVVVGAVEAGTVVKKLEGALGDWRNPQQTTVDPAPDAPRPAHLLRRNVFIADKYQSDIVLGLPGPRRSAPDYLDASLMNTILGVFGMMGRIGESVREKQGLAYYASSRLEGGLGPGPWTARAGVAPENVERAIESIRDEIRRIQDEPVSDTELADSQAFRTGSLPMSLETNGGIADVISDMELFDLGFDYLYRYKDLIDAITPERIQAAARRYLSPDDIAIAVSGPADE